jgi:uncharacterized membrane protein YuzA (DUF378 family)
VATHGHFTSMLYILINVCAVYMYYRRICNEKELNENGKHRIHGLEP